MQLTPRYDGPPLLRVGPRAEGPHPVLAQRARLEELLGSLNEDEWRHPTRCEGWTVQDVVTHLISTNGFWAISIESGLAGTPTRFLATFDPVATPAQLVDLAAGTSTAETLDQLVTSNAALVAAIDAVGDGGWDVIAEAPPGHLPIRLVADHALWDSWVHERDIVLPLGRVPVEDPDEVLTSLRYGAGLGRAFEAALGRTGPGDSVPVVLDVEAPDAEIVVRCEDGTVCVDDGPAPDDALRHRGGAVETLELLSMRDVGRPLPAAVAALTAGLATVFDQT